jgi:transcriptional regulator with XRE-family HTH domain
MRPRTEWTRDNGRALRELRRERGLTQEALADAARVSARTIKRLETGAQAPRPSTLQLIAEALGCSWEEFRDAAVDLAGAPIPGDPPAFLVDGDGHTLTTEPRFVARSAELETLALALEHSRAGRAKVVFVTGEAGTGKTALMREFERRAWDSYHDLVVLSGRCNAHTGPGDPYLPFREVLGLLTGDVEQRWSAGALTSQQARRLWDLLPVTIAAITRSSPDLIDTFVSGTTLTATALSYARCAPIDVGPLRQIAGRKAKLPPDASLQQTDLFEQFARVLQAVARERPMVIILDDLQWVDPGSVGLLFHISRQLADQRMLLVGAYRPSEIALGRGGNRHPLEPVINEIQALHGQHEIDLERSEGRAFVEALLATEPNRLTVAFRDALFSQTAGHALFTIELLRGLQERGALMRDGDGRWIEGPHLDWLTLPGRVESVIEERMGRLDEQSRRILNLAAIEGDRFTAEILARLVDLSCDEMIELLSRGLDKRHHLVTAHGIRRLDGQRLSQYRFGHILFQKYLYGNLDEVERSLMHEKLGMALETTYGERAGEIAVQLAYHFRQAGLMERAIDYLIRAGQQAARLFDHANAVEHHRNGLSLLESMPEDSRRLDQELSLLAGLMPYLCATQGYDSDEIRRCARRVRELCESVTTTPQVFPALTYLVFTSVERAEYRTALAVSEDMVAISETMGDSLSGALAHASKGYALVLLGQFERAMADNLLVTETYDHAAHGPIVRQVIGFDIELSALAFRALMLCLRGYPVEAIDLHERTIELAHETDHPFSSYIPLYTTCFSHAYLGEIEKLDEGVQRMFDLAEVTGLEIVQILGAWYRGWLHALRGDHAQGIPAMRKGEAAYWHSASHSFRTVTTMALVESLLQAGSIDEASHAIDDALAFVDSSGEGVCEVDLLRLKGELLIARRADTADVDACFRQAVEIARGRETKLQELKTATSWARWLAQRGRRDEARDVLAPVYGWFSEGFETQPLCEARKLLGRLGADTDSPQSSA